jgi:Zn-dependent peptidase ImmA (M78 family)
MYTHPGRLFIERFGPVEGPESIKQYVAFLRKEAEIGTRPPLNLAAIFQRFGIPVPKRAALPGQQGLLINSDLGIILIEERDLETRQRFSEAHELVELLFAAMPTRNNAYNRDVGNFKYAAKERLCNEGAAELLMPAASYLPRIDRLGVSFETGRLLASEYEVSLSAALVHMTKIGPGRHAVVLWIMKNKPTEIRNRVPDNQLALIDIPLERVAPKKLRVEWAFTGPGVSYIPTDKSVPEDSSIYSAWLGRNFTSGADRLELGSIRGTCYSENLPFEVDGEWSVLSLLHLPGDAVCRQQT